MLSPGAERSLMKLGDDIPQLTKSIRELATALAKQADYEPANKEGITLKITLTDEEWSELANALSIRAMQIRDKEEPSEDMSEKDLIAWANALDSCYKKVARVLEQNGITY
jgi:hypothetical protein